MPSIPHLPSRIRLILWYPLIAGVTGAFYSHIIAVAHGSPVLTFDSMPRGVMTGVVIAGVLISFEVFVLAEQLGAPLRQASFPVHVAVKTVIYLVVIIFALALGGWAFPSPSEPGIQRRVILFSTDAAFIFVFRFDVNRPAVCDVHIIFFTCL